MLLVNEFIKNIEQQSLFQKKDYLLLAVSGGADSVVLCELCHDAGFNFEIAHCNFQLRGEESERDEKFVRALAKKYQVKIFVKRFETKKYAEENKVSIQVAARELRYAWFDELLSEVSGNKYQVSGIRCEVSGMSDQLTILSSDTPLLPSSGGRGPYLLTAHHANDNIETLLMNFFKGTGIKGLQGILPKQGKIIRPLLFAKKEELLSFIKGRNLEFVEDSSNNSDKYTRNYFRHQLIPSVQKVFPQAEENLISNMERFHEIEILYQQSIGFHKKRLLEQKGNEIHIPVLKLQKSQPLKTIVYEIIKDYGFTPHQSDDVIGLLHRESGKYISSATHKIIRNRNWLIIAPANTLEAGHILINEEDVESDGYRVDFEFGKLKIKKEELVSEKIPSSALIAMLDAKSVTFPLLLRKWKQGDYFYPLGMPGKKKLSKFFVDQKMSMTEKEKVWVIESNKRIIWIIGKRIDDRFKITGKTKKVLSFYFKAL
ncbi:MAG: tRNA lysidine(34) synthetase TilS [Ginsengibacter sp.]